MKLKFRQPQTIIFWAPVLEMVLTGSSGNGSLLGWELGPLRQSAKLWLHDAGITHIHELVSVRALCGSRVFFVVLSTYKRTNKRLNYSWEHISRVL